MIKKFVLRFSENQLIETIFDHPLNRESKRCVRGKTSGAFQKCGTFQWTSAVQALSILILKSICLPDPGVENIPVIQGGAGSPASSLDYSISKGTIWISEMFGDDSRGNALAKHLVNRTNPNRKRPGPVTISLNHHFLAPSRIEIFVDQVKLESLAEIENLLFRISNDWNEPKSKNSGSALQAFEHDAGEGKANRLLPIAA